MAIKKDIFNKLKANPKLPTPSGTALEILRLCRRDDSSLGEIAKVIQGDPALSAEVLKYANSAFLATGIKVASIQKATVKLGMTTVMNLALGFSLLSANKNGNCVEFNYDCFWSTSLAHAVAARTIASYGKSYDSEEMFVCSLLSHIGELALASLFPREYGTIIKDQPLREVRIQLERSQFGIDGAELTTELFLDWGLPASYAYAAGFHEDLDMVELGDTTTRDVAELLNISCRIAHLCHNAKVDKEWLSKTEHQLRLLDGIDEDFSTVFDAIVNNWTEWGETLNIRTIRCLRYEEIKAGVETYE